MLYMQLFKKVAKHRKRNTLPAFVLSKLLVSKKHGGFKELSVQWKLMEEKDDSTLA